MKEFVKSLSSLTLGMSVFGVQLLADMFELTPADEYTRAEQKAAATRALDSVAHAAVDQCGPVLRGTFYALDNLQRGMTALAFNVLSALRSDRPTQLADETDRAPSEYRFSDTDLNQRVTVVESTPVKHNASVIKIHRHK